MSIVRKPLRRGLRIILAHLAHWALKKHKPTVIAVVGEGKTGIAREAIYRVIKSKYPVRRNIEPPDAEFVLPLIILGTHEYPRSYFSWIKALVRSMGLLLVRPAHKHFLVLEIGYSNKKIFDYFWDITHPSVLVVCGEAPYLSKDQTATAADVFGIREGEDLKPYLETAVKVAKVLEISEEEARKSLINFTLPPARIRILSSRNGGIVIDATHQYYPPSEEALDEILEALPGKKIFIDPACQHFKNKPPKIKKGEVGVILGPKKRMWPVLLELIKTPWFD